MKKAAISCFILIACVAIVLFFPISKTTAFSGNGSILNSEKERVADCSIAVEVKELKSLVLRYRMSFSFILNDELCYASEEVRFPASVSETRYGDCLISQFYYDGETNSMKHCSLSYWGDHSYAEIFWEDNYYTLSME